MPPTLRLKELDLYLRPVRTRLPFRYGKANVTGLPYLHLRARFEPAVVGLSAAALPPLWFDKASPSHEATIADLLRSVRVAADVYRGLPAGSAYALHRDGEPETRRRLPGFNDLTAGFGVALLDAAVVDAVCRLADRPFHAALRDDLLGFGALPLPARPLDRIHVRHTVGLADPISAADVREPIGDGLPETLEQVVRAHGVRYFKIKVSGDAAASLDRLRAITAVLDRLAGDYRVTLDGNEQFPDMRSAADFLARASEIRSLWARTLWVEQPVERGAALSERVPDVGKPMLIDESDGTDAAVGRALELGYRGISAKTCKGVFRTLHSHRALQGTAGVLSSEDLMNIPVLPLQQDLCIASALGIAHSERNGHHYIRSFEFLSPGEREAVLREYPSLYRPLPGGMGTVRIEDGALDLREVNAFGLGARSEPDWPSLTAAPADGTFCAP